MLKKKDVWYYQASLRRLRKDGTYKGFCGGVVISTDHILTAAHCCDVSLYRVSHPIMQRGFLDDFY